MNCDELDLPDVKWFNQSYDYSNLMVITLYLFSNRSLVH